MVTASRLLAHIRAELLEGCPNAADLLGQPAVENSLCHRLGVQRLQTAGDSLQQGLVVLSGDINGNNTLSGNSSYFSSVLKCL